MFSFLSRISHSINKRYQKKFGKFRDYIVISYPKSGRTWLRVIMDKLNIMLRYDHDETEIVRQLPWPELSNDKSIYKNNKIILLVRDPRDTVVSAYFQAVKRKGVYHGPISDFIRDKRYGIKKILSFHEIWQHNINKPIDVLVVRYEDMQRDIYKEIDKILHFLGKQQIKETKIRNAINYGSFDNVHKLEQKGALTNTYKGVFGTHDKSDKESYKTRKGKVGGFNNYLTKEDIAYCNEIMQTMENPFYKDFT
jgi:hypothetical protein